MLEIDDYTFAFPVEDATGIRGTWDFDLSFTPGGLLAERSGASGGESAETNGGISVAEAINRQLGLRLEKRKRRLPAIVIDRMDLTPIEN